MAGFEGFTVLAILEARDKASEIFAKVDESLGRFSETADRAGESASTAGARIDEALGRDVSVSDRLDIATGRLAAAQAKGAEAARALTDAERELRDAQAAAAGAGDDDAAAADRLMAADTRLAKAQRDAAAAAKGLSDAERGQVAALRESAAAGDEAAAAQVKLKDKSEESGINLGSVGKIAGITAIGLGVAGAVMVRAAGNFQDSTTHLVTDAGESAKNLAMVQAGILNVSTATGQSAGDITNAMYHIESSGFHAQAGLNILKTAAEGARIGGADLDTTSKALVGTLTAYYGTSLTAAQATKDSRSLMSQLVATVGSGDMRMQDLAASLHSVTAVAASAHLPFAQIGAAIATMTAQGMTADQTTQDLGHVIGSLQNPTAVQANEMRALGLNANVVSKNLGSTGLAGTLDEMRNAVLRNTHGGYVLLNMMKGMTPAAQGLATGIMSGTISTHELTTAVKTLSPEQAALITRFKTSATSVTGLKQTFNAAMSKMLGGQMGLNVGLMLTGKHMRDLAKNTAAVTAAGKSSAGMTAAWKTIQGTFNFKLDQAKTGVENTGIAIGTALLPAVTAILSQVTKIVIPIAEWTAKHKKLTEIIFISVGAVAGMIAIISVAKKAFDAVSGAVKTAQATMKGLGKIAGLTGKEQEKAAKSAASVQEESSGKAAAAAERDAGKTAAANEEAAGKSAAAAEKAAGEEEAASGEAAAAAEADAGEAAAANETAAAESSGSWAKSAAQMIASGAKWVAQSAVKAAQAAASYLASAAQAVAGWAVAGAQMIAQGALWVAQTVAKVAVVVGSQVAAAAATAAAWVVANAAMLLGIGLIVAAVVGAVILIVKHWRQISDFAKKAFDDVLAIVDHVIGWVKQHWPLLLAILLGPVAVATLEIAKHYKQILRAVSEAIDWVKQHWPLLLAIITGPIGLAVLFVTKHFDQLRNGAASMVHDVASFFASLPGRILSGLGNIGMMLFDSGKKIIQGLINGVMSMIGGIGNAIGSVASTIKSFLPFSPAKQGPLSGSGDPSYSGRSIARKLAQGLIAGTGDVTGASARLAGAVTLGPGTAAAGTYGSGGLTALGAGAGGGVVINLTINDPHMMTDSDMTAFVTRMGPVLSRMLGQAGVHVRMG